MKDKDPNRLVGPNGEFVSSYHMDEDTITIGYLEELCEWLYYHDALTYKQKLRRLKAIEGMIRKHLAGGHVSSMKINYIPTWSTKLINDEQCKTNG